MAGLVLNREQIRLVDRLAVQQYGVSGLVLMENAGRGCADKLRELGIAGPVVVCCGKGNNAGDGFVIARHLDALSTKVKVFLWCDPEQLPHDAVVNYRILTKTEVPLVVFNDRYDHASFATQLNGADWVVDALLGTGARGQPRPPLDEVIEQLNACPGRKLSVDVPSGLDCDSGEASGAVFRADHTCTFVAAKPGLLLPSAKPLVGQIHVIDIGVPRQLIQQVLAAAERG